MSGVPSADPFAYSPVNIPANGTDFADETAAIIPPESSPFLLPPDPPPGTSAKPLDNPPTDPAFYMDATEAVIPRDRSPYLMPPGSTAGLHAGANTGLHAGANTGVNAGMNADPFTTQPANPPADPYGVGMGMNAGPNPPVYDGMNAAGNYSPVNPPAQPVPPAQPAQPAPPARNPYGSGAPGDDGLFTSMSKSKRVTLAVLGVVIALLLIAVILLCIPSVREKIFSSGTLRAGGETVVTAAYPDERRGADSPAFVFAEARESVSVRSA